jgi:hypothetical protein
MMKVLDNLGFRFVKPVSVIFCPVGGKAFNGFFCAGSLENLPLARYNGYILC